jgi:two-component system, NtrC family, sensor kinase
MRRPSSASGPARSRGRVIKRKARKSPIRRKSTVELLDQLDRRTRERDEALEQQAATSEILRVISSSAGDLHTVFQTLLGNALHLCVADFGLMYQRDSSGVKLMAHRGADRVYLDYMRRGMDRPGPKTLIAQVIKSRAPVQFDDYAKSQAYLDRDPLAVIAVERGGVRSILGVPMLREGKLIGAIALYRKKVRPFTDKQMELLQSFAAQAVIAIENTRLFNELRQSLEQQTATADVLEVISRSAFDLRAVFETVVESSVRLCGAHRAIIYRFDGELLRLGTAFNATEEFKEWIERNPIRPGRHTAAARAALERQMIHIPDVLVDPEYTYGGAHIEKIRTVLGVPILKGDDLLGAMVIYHLEVKPFTEKQIALVEAFSDQAAIAIENVRLLDALRHRTDELGRSVGELRALGEVSQAVNSTLDLENVLSTIVAKAVELSGTEAGVMYGYDEEAREFRLRATCGVETDMIKALTQRHINFDEPNIALAFARREPVQTADLQEEDRSELNEMILRAGYRARLIAPLLRGDEIVGMLVVRRKLPGQFGQNTVDLIKTFAAQSALAIQNARLFDSVEARTRELAKSLEDLRTAQDRLVQTEKLASLGQLTAGIAHEIKNPLNFVNNFSSVSVELIDELRGALAGAHLDGNLRAEIAEIADTLQGNLDKIVQHGKRADSIVKNMLLHSRQGSGEHRPVDINALVEESLNLAYHGARAEKEGFNITLERSFDPDAGEIDLFPQEITRVLLNLISNGFYAATKRKAETNGGDHEPTVAATTRNLDTSVEIRIRDNGAGIPPEVKEKMFNPFFTTKPAGEGTGLGLSISHDIIVKQHGGSIEVDTEPGEFTEIRIVLPRSAVGTRA